MVEHSRGPIAGFAWARQGVGYSLVGPLPPATLHPIADTIRRQIDTST
ncbi:MAG: hypothetical protein J0H91_05545 [Rhodospirillales bacterium]|nr:hypothetical protein [Rhodospirillales bacterium]